MWWQDATTIKYVRQDGKWRFARMDFIPYFTVPFDEGWAQDDLLKMGRT